MIMATPYRQLREKMSLQARAQAAQKTREILAEMALQELRQALELTQEEVAKLLKTSQANVSKLERRTDMYISTLREFIQAMGGKLEIVARFPGGSVKIDQFHDVT